MSITDKELKESSQVVKVLEALRTFFVGKSTTNYPMGWEFTET